MNRIAIAPSRPETDPNRFFWYGVSVLIMVASALPMLGIVRIPRLFGYTTTLIIHELAAFLYFGHTFFSNIWSLLIRRTQPPAVGIWARALLRKLCLGVTAPTARGLRASALSFRSTCRRTCDERQCGVPGKMADFGPWPASRYADRPH